MVEFLTLKSLPRDALIEILKWCFGDAILGLYKCGDAILNAKLSSGAVKVMDFQDKHAYSTSRWPQGLHLFFGLETLRIHRPRGCGLQRSSLSNLYTACVSLSALDLDVEGCMDPFFLPSLLKFTCLNTVRLVDRRYCRYPGLTEIMEYMPPSAIDIDLGFLRRYRPNAPCEPTSSALNEYAAELRVRLRLHSFFDSLSSMEYYYDSANRKTTSSPLHFSMTLTPQHCPLSNTQKIKIMAIDWNNFTPHSWPPMLKSLTCGSPHFDEMKIPLHVFALLPRSLEKLKLYHLHNDKDASSLMSAGKTALEKDPNWACIQSQLQGIARENWYRRHISPSAIKIIKFGGLLGLPLTLKKLVLEYSHDSCLLYTLPPFLRSFRLKASITNIKFIMRSLPLLLEELHFSYLDFRFSTWSTRPSAIYFPLLSELSVKNITSPMNQDDVDSLISLFGSSLKRLALASPPQFTLALNVPLPHLIELEIENSVDHRILKQLPSQLKILKLESLRLQDAICLPRSLQYLTVDSISSFVTFMTLPSGLKMLFTAMQYRHSDDLIAPPHVFLCSEMGLNRHVFPSQLEWQGYPGFYGSKDELESDEREMLFDGNEEERFDSDDERSMQLDEYERKPLASQKSSPLVRAYMLHSRYLESSLHHLIDTRIKYGPDSFDRNLSIDMDWGRYSGRQTQITDYYCL